jgi:hypothetical protein
MEKLMNSLYRKQKESMTNSQQYSPHDRDTHEILDRVIRIETMMFKLCKFIGMDPRTGEKIGGVDE